MTRATLSIKRNNNIVTMPPAIKAPKTSQIKTSQKAPEQTREQNKADIHAKKKQQRIDRIAKHWTLFSEPEAKPLMIGIKEALIADAKARSLDMPDGQIKQGLRAYINRKMYQKALLLGGKRFDMNGQPNGEVSAEQQAVAEKQLVEWSNK